MGLSDKLKDGDIDSTIIQILRERIIDDKNAELTADTDLRNSCDLDSRDILELVMDVEDHYEIVLSDDEIRKASTVSDFRKYVQEKSGK